MDTHISTYLQGPLTKNRGWWPQAVVSSDADASAVPDRGPEGTAASQGQAPDSHGVPPGGRLPDEPIRSELVNRVRREIAADSYETPAKWEAALERLRRHLEGE
jgi:hypothetical protein